MATKSLPLRLDGEMYHLLKEIADLRGTSMVEIVRESLRAYLPEVVGEETHVVEDQLKRLRALAERQPGYLKASLEEAMHAEVEQADPLEEDLEVVRREEGVTAQVLRALR